ncbi:MAG: tetratricopeptide repeat protein [Kiritimatiellia bacterium]
MAVAVVAALAVEVSVVVVAASAVAEPPGDGKGRLMKLLFVVLLLIGTVAVAAEDRLTFADGLFRRGFYTQAAAEYEAFLKTDPASDVEADAQFRLAECYEQSNRAEEARALYLQVIHSTTGERRYATQLRLATSFLEANRPKEALPTLEALLTQKVAPPLQRATAYRLALCYEKLERARDAQTLYRLLAKNSDETADVARLRLAALLVQEQQASEALELYLSVARAGVTPQRRREALAAAALLAAHEEKAAQAAQCYLDLRELSVASETKMTAAENLSAAWACYQAVRLEEARSFLAAARLEPLLRTSDEVRYLDASITLALEDRTAAKTLYEKLLAEFPKSKYASSAAYKVLFICSKENDPQAFLSAYANVAPFIAETERNAVMRLRLNAAVQAKNVEQAQMASASIMAHDTPEAAADALYQMGWLAQQLEQWAVAGQHYLDVVTRWPTASCAPRAAYAAAYAFQRAGNREKATQAVQAAVATNDRAIVPDALMLRARMELSERKAAAAATTLDEYLGRFPNGTAAAEANYLRGLLFFHAQDWAAADHFLNAALAFKTLPHAKQIDSAIRRAQALHAIGQDSEAAALLQPLLTLKDAATVAPSYLNWLVTFQLSRKAYDEARMAAKTLAEHAEVPADRVLANVYLGQIAEAQGQEASALAAYTTALSVSPASATVPPTAHDAAAAVGLGRLRQKEGSWEKAQEAYELALKRASSDTLEGRALQASAYAGLATVYQALNQPDQALRAEMSLIIFFDDPLLVPEAFKHAIARLEAQHRKQEAQTLRSEFKVRYPNAYQE